MLPVLYMSPVQSAVCRLSLLTKGQFGHCVIIIRITNCIHCKSTREGTNSNNLYKGKKEPKRGKETIIWLFFFLVVAEKKILLI